MFFDAKIWDSKELADHIEAAGFHAGQNVVLHSSLKSLGHTKNGPNTIVDALLSVIGAQANLLVPTFTYSLPAWKSDPFDYDTSRARTGAIPEYVRKRPDSIRSFHPTHSVSVVGPDAVAITENHMDYTALGIGSPFSRMLDRDATILMLGTHQDTNSSLHLMEVMAGLPYINVCFTDHTDFETAWYHNVKGEVEFAPIREVPGCSRGFRSIEPHLLKHNVMKKFRIGNAHCQILPMRELAEVSTEVLRRYPSLLLCSLDHCAICPKRRKLMKNLRK